MIKHRPIFDFKKIEKHYSDKDGVPVRYVCTSALSNEAWAMDIFYRETPHPVYGNRYFGLYKYAEPVSGEMIVKITNADAIENVEFGMVSNGKSWEYSQHRHDYLQVGNCCVDGGRAYFKRVGDISEPSRHFKIVNGSFVDLDIC